MADIEQFEGYNTEELDTWWKQFSETDMAKADNNALEGWYQGYEAKFGNDSLRRKHKAAQLYQMVMGAGGLEDYKKRKARTLELETQGAPSVASTLLGQQKTQSSSLASKTLLGV